MNEELPDPLLDAKLREVALPANLLARLRATSIPSGVELDQALRDVPLPNDFSLRLRAHVDDFVIDDALNDVAVPTDLLAKLHIIPEVRRKSSWRRLALAASLLMVVGGLYGLTLNSIFTVIRPRAAVAERLPVIDLGPLRLEMRQSQLPVIQVARDMQTVAPFAPPRDDPNAIAVKFIPFGRQTAPGAAGQMFELQANGKFRPDDDIFLLRWGALGAAYAGGAPQPELERVLTPRASGIDLPLVRGYDRVFWLKQGVHPPLSPAVDPALRTSRLILSNRTDSVDLTRRRLAARRLPDPSSMHVEDFLAAVDYRFPTPEPGAVAIHTAAGPALLDQQQHHLLQVGVKVGRASRSERASHLTVALDISTSMGTGDRLETAKRAIAALAKHAGPDDRFSLIAFHHDVAHIVEPLAHNELGEFATIIAPLRASGGDNLAAGLQQAVSLLLGSGLDDQLARRLVVLTDEQELLPLKARNLAGNMVATADELDIQTTIVQIGATRDGPPLFPELNAAGTVTCLRARTDKDVLWGMVESLTGVSSVVAVDPALQVEFNPAAVRAYRLVGHGTTAIGELDSLSESTLLHSEEEATALYEVWLHPDRGDEIAWVRAEWRDPQTGGIRETQRQPVRRRQIAASRDEMPLSLQAAAMAAEIGKVFGESFEFELSNTATFRHHKKSRDIRELLEARGELSPALETWSDFRELMDILAALDNVRRNQFP